MFIVNFTHYHCHLPCVLPIRNMSYTTVTRPFVHICAKPTCRQICHGSFTVKSQIDGSNPISNGGERNKIHDLFLLSTIFYIFLHRCVWFHGYPHVCPIFPGNTVIQGPPWNILRGVPWEHGGVRRREIRLLLHGDQLRKHLCGSEAESLHLGSDGMGIHGGTELEMGYIQPTVKRPETQLRMG